MRVLFIATRAPYGRMHGHKMGIRTYINALKLAGHEVTLAAFDVPGDTPSPEDLGVETSYIQLPSRLTIAGNFLKGWLTRKLSINECLYLSSRADEEIQAIIKKKKIEFVVADMLRTAAYAERSGLPWIIDHEDLLSERYALWARRSSGDENILGYLEQSIPAFLRPPAKIVFRAFLGRESGVLDTRELYWTDRALASSLRSREETERLSKRTRRPVFCMPVSVPIPVAPADSLTRRPMVALFTGGLTYQPNLDALRFYVEAIIPEFDRQSVPLPDLRIVGAAPDNLRLPLEHPSIRFLGYVPDLESELRQAQVFFAPIVSGTGIKTKVLEALAAGLPLIALPAGLSGLHGEDGKDYLQASTPAEFVDQFVRLRDNPATSIALGKAGRELAISHYSVEAASEIIKAQISNLGARA